MREDINAQVRQEYQNATDFTDCHGFDATYTDP